VIPGNGIYACWASLSPNESAVNEKVAAAVNVGTRPTFGGSELLIEAHLLDFDQDLYGAGLTLEFVDRLRAEVEFDSVDALVEAITKDIEQVRRLLQSSPV
jgi:riboflavin kinase/FMN adenylyltransferase